VNHYYIHGHSGGQTSNFDTFQTSMIGVGSKSFPAAIHITRRGNITIENLSLKYVGGRADGILVEPSPDGLGQSSMITIKNVHVSMAGDNLAGIPLHFKGGFGFYIEGGGMVRGPRVNSRASLSRMTLKHATRLGSFGLEPCSWRLTE
jgi:hypothetical protein